MFPVVVSNRWMTGTVDDFVGGDDGDDVVHVAAPKWSNHLRVTRTEAANNHEKKRNENLKILWFSGYAGCSRQA